MSLFSRSCAIQACLFFAKEYSLGYSCCSRWSFQISFQNRTVVPSATLHLAIPLNQSTNFSTSLHQKDPFSLDACETSASE
jgi:hypothetical protein